MNETSNAPMSPEPAGFAGWFSTWMEAVTKPSEQSYAAMAERLDAQSNNRAFTWVFLAGTFAAIISGVLSAILELAGFAPQIPGLSDLVGSAPRSALASLGIALCTSPISGAISVLFFAIFVGIIQWVAKMFKGIGTFSQLAYVMAAISVPVSLVTSLLTPFSAIGVIGYCFSAITLIIGLYSMYLQLLAVKTVNKFGWGEAAGTYFLPLILIACICFCIVFGLASIFGVAYSELLNQGFAP
ncbi:MAG: YIP1 family protein [Anaerolineales bacterium]|nr:YIP1 family protein [Anaerolineales bacterium]